MRWSALVCCLAVFLGAGCPDDTKSDASSGPADAAGSPDHSGSDATAPGDSASSDLRHDAAGSDATVLACPTDDQYEPNNDAAHAAALGHPGPYRGVMIACDADDWYAISVPADFGIGVQLTNFAPSVNLDL